MSWSEIKGKKEKWLIPFLIGLLLLVIAMPANRKEESQVEVIHSENKVSDEGYIQNMEAQLEEVLGKVEGVGAVSVMITVSASSEKIVEKDEDVSMQTTSGETGNSSSTDRRETSVYTGTGGEESPYVVKEISPQISGVLVVAEGGNQPTVVENITSAVQALFGIETHKIKVMKHN